MKPWRSSGRAFALLALVLFVVAPSTHADLEPLPNDIWEHPPDACLGIGIVYVDINPGYCLYILYATYCAVGGELGADWCPRECVWLETEPYYWPEYDLDGCQRYPVQFLCAVYGLVNPHCLPMANGAG